MAYIGQSLVEGTRRVYNYTATASQTTFNAIYQVGVVDVYQNGSLLTPSSYTATDGATIVLNTGATAGDTIAIHCHNTFSVTDTVPASGGAFSGEVTLEDGLIVDSGDVGIGTSSPSALLDIDAGSSTGTHLEITTTGNGHNFDMVDGGATTRIRNVGGVLRIGADHNDEAADSRLQFDVDGSERMRIDSSGNLLVGKTSSSSNVLGVEFRPSGRIFGCVDGNSVSVFNRQTSDGDIVEFRKDNTAVGSIGTTGSEIYVGYDNAGLRFRSVANVIMPWDAGSNSSRDNALSLGNDGNRFKDLYLSGGVYLGGTGSANKLDDYEEGTWTPSLSGYTMGSSNAGWYVKIGRTCYVSAIVSWSSGSGNPSYVDGLPFTASTDSNGSYAANSISITEVGGIGPNGSNDVFYGRVGASSSVTSIQLLQVDYSSGTHTGTPPTFSSSGIMRFSFTYSTS